MWALGKQGDLGIKKSSNGHGDVTAVSTGPPPVMDLGIKRPGLLGGPVERTTHRPRFGASPSLLCSSVTRKRPKCFKAGIFSGSLIYRRTPPRARWEAPIRLFPVRGPPGKLQNSLPRALPACALAPEAPAFGDLSSKQGKSNVHTFFGL